MGRKKAQPCTVCGYPRKYVQMMEKEGKDGRIARWPEYEICPNKDNLDLHPTTKNVINDLDADLRIGAAQVVRRVIEQKQMPTGIMYQVNDIDEPLEEIAECLLHYEGKAGGLPMAIGMRPEEAGDFTEIDWELANGKEVTIPIWPLKLSPKYGYILLIKEVI